jgi:hypothetical protein
MPIMYVIINDTEYGLILISPLIKSSFRITPITAYPTIRPAAVKSHLNILFNIYSPPFLILI